MNLQEHIIDHVSCGCLDMNHSLGIQQMPQGYALMLNPDHTHYYWLRADGMESVIDWNKWRVYRGAKKNRADAAGAMDDFEMRGPTE